MSQPITLFANKETILRKSEWDGDCLIWKGSTDMGGRPKLSIRGEEGKTKTIQPRRVMWESEHGPIPERRYISVSCNHPLCLAHLEMVTRGEVVSRTAQKPDTKARRRLAGLRQRERNAKLDMEKARYIRECGKRAEDLAKELDVGVSTVYQTRRQMRWKEANPWSALFASNDSSKKAA